jgi:GGDEF domain-containing protein
MPASAAINYLADICRAQSRKSDVVGYVGESRFAILAPETNGTGARQFVGRLQRAVESSGSVRVLKSGRPLRAGFFAVSDFGAAPVEATEVVRRAEAALQFTQTAAFSNGTLSFDELPAS